VTLMEERAEDLLPVPEQAEAMTAWLAEARELVARLGRYRAELEAIEQRALPYDAAMRQHDRDTHPRAEQANALRIELDSLLRSGDLGEDVEAQIDRKQKQLDESERELDTRRTWRFAEACDQRAFDELVDLQTVSQRLLDPDPRTGVIASVERRLQWARECRRRTIEEPAAAWAEAIRSIGDRQDCPRYDGLVITPQPGLIPIGRDPASKLWEFVALQTGAPPSRREDGKLDLDTGTGFILVLIPGGTFWMGSQSTDPYAPNYSELAFPNEAPVQQITLDPFFLSRYEVTVAQWERLTAKRPSSRTEGDLCPVNFVTWTECRRVLRLLGMTLPTEAQWEYAARGGTATTWWCGNDRRSLQTSGNVMDLSAEKVYGVSGRESWDDGYAGPAPVGCFRANPFGLHDVIGNVWEWTLDRHAGYGNPVCAGDGLRISSDVGNNPIVRGGSFIDGAVSQRSSVRSSQIESTGASNIGMRPARPLAK
jgi:formylglycine-generating enzyme required for sulfatase activity